MTFSKNIMVDSLRVESNKTTILDDISFEINKSEVLALIGPNAEGKSTVGLSLTGGIADHRAIHMFSTWGADERRITRGDIDILGKRINLLHPSERGIGYVPQQNSLIPSMSVKNNIGVALPDKISKNERENRLQLLLELFDLAELSNQLPNKLSGGQSQRVAIARALIKDPNFIILDEAFSNQDTRRYEFMSAIRQRIKNNNSSVLFITHLRDDAVRFSDRVAILHDGKIQQIGKPAVVFKKPKTRFVAEYFSQVHNFLPIDALLNYSGEKCEILLPQGTQQIGFHSGDIKIDAYNNAGLMGSVVDVYEDLQNTIVRVFIPSCNYYLTGTTVDNISIGQTVALSFSLENAICFDANDQLIER
jgi:iron(III) transport system ATP-binding protein